MANAARVRPPGCSRSTPKTLLADSLPGQWSPETQAGDRLLRSCQHGREMQGPPHPIADGECRVHRHQRAPARLQAAQAGVGGENPVPPAVPATDPAGDARWGSVHGNGSRGKPGRCWSESATSLLGKCVQARFRLTRRAVRRLMDAVTGTVLIGFGLDLALSEH